MAQATYIQDGDRIDYTPAATVTAGDVVVIGGLVGVALATIDAGSTGAVALRGIYSLPKATGAINAGADVYWDATAKKCTTTASGNTLMGRATAAAAANDTTVKVRLNT